MRTASDNTPEVMSQPAPAETYRHKDYLCEYLQLQVFLHQNFSSNSEYLISISSIFSLKNQYNKRTIKIKKYCIYYVVKRESMLFLKKLL